MGEVKQEQHGSILDLEKASVIHLTSNENPKSSNGTVSPSNDPAEWPSKDEQVVRVPSLGEFLQTTPSEDYEKRPACFKNTFQECLFVLTTTVAVAQASIITGLTGVINAHIVQDLHMTQAETTWITAGTA